MGFLQSTGLPAFKLPCQSSGSHILVSVRITQRAGCSIAVVVGSSTPREPVSD